MQSSLPLGRDHQRYAIYRGYPRIFPLWEGISPGLVPSQFAGSPQGAGTNTPIEVFGQLHKGQ